MSKIERNNRLKLHTYFGIASICLPFIASMVAVALSGSRGYAGLGPFMSLPIIQLVYSFVLVRRPVYLAILTAALVAIVSHLLAMAAIESKLVTLGLDHYGYFDFLVIYILCSIMLWELAHASFAKLHNENTI